MKFPKLDKRTKEDLLEKIKQTSLSYVPEWRFDEENKDVGTTLSFLFAEMFEDTIKRFNKIPEKNMVEFFSYAGTQMQPAIPARGYAAFQMVSEEVEGLLIPSKTKIKADQEDGHSEIFETLNTVYASVADLKCIYQEDGKKDTIYRIFEQTEEQKNPENIRLFCESGENLQRHIFYIGHQEVLKIKGNAEIIIQFTEYQENGKLNEIMPLFEQEELVQFSYCSNGDYQPFEQVKVKENKIYLYKGKLQSAIDKTVIHNIESYYIRCEVKKIEPFRDFHIQEIFLTSRGTELKPDQILANGEEQERQECYPFGERLMPYAECYFCCDDALWKKDSKIELSFHLDYVQIPLDTQEKTERDWKFVMKESDFVPESEYDISIEEVIWEYYNGNGFCRLKENKKYGKIFQLDMGTLGRRMTIQFDCPKDLEPLSVGAREHCCIRARVLSLKNQYKLNGYYITPLLSNIKFSYNYTDKLKVPTHLFSENRMELQYWEERQLVDHQEELKLLYCSQEEMTVYLGFLNAPEDSLLRYLVIMDQENKKNMSGFQFSFWNGMKFQNLSVVDGTEGLKKTGILTLLGAKGFQKLHLFQKDYYWIKVQDHSGIYRNLTKGKGKLIKEICGNVTEIMALETMDEEQFQIYGEEKNPEFHLLYQPIYDSQVFVLEEESGENIWVKWQEVEDFITSNPEDRHYQLDHNLGILKFSDGIHGKMPEQYEENSIRIQYRVGGGKNSSFPAKTQARLVEPKGYIKNVIFPLPIQGGMDQETVEQAMERKMAELKHQGRAITARDFEAMAFESNRNILKARCYSGLNLYGEKEQGSIVLSVLLGDYKNPSGMFKEARDGIEQYLSNRISGTIVSWNKIHIVEAEFVRITAYLTVEMPDFEQVLEWKQKLLEKLQSFLDPVSGNFDGNGWEIGVLPNQTQIVNAIGEIQGEAFIRSVRMVAGIKREHGYVEMPLEKAMELPFVIGISGEHEVEFLIS